jgi:hypothetical protein
LNITKYLKREICKRKSSAPYLRIDINDFRYVILILHIKILKLITVATKYIISFFPSDSTLMMAP